MWVNSNVYIFRSLTLSTTHVKGKAGYSGWMTLKLGRCVCGKELHICAKFHDSMTKVFEKTHLGRGVSPIEILEISSEFLLFLRVYVLFLYQHVPSRLFCLLVTGANRWFTNSILQTVFLQTGRFFFKHVVKILP